MKRITVRFRFGTRREAHEFWERLVELRWVDPTDDFACDMDEVVVAITAGELGLLAKLYQLVGDLVAQ